AQVCRHLTDTKLGGFVARVPTIGLRSRADISQAAGAIEFMSAELKLKLEESASPPPLPRLMPPPLPQAAGASVNTDIRLHSERDDAAESLPKGILGGVVAAVIRELLRA